MKTADVEHLISGVLGRRKLPQRGFYRDPSPGMHAVRQRFEEAARNAGKTAALHCFGFLHSKEDPVKGLTHLLQTDDFGLPRRERREQQNRR